ncbi:hypothetical protein [Streptomyces sp. DT117]|uniref:hypothetical protein n=1 Tax=Streptomyces sp. DT117 TaxID=3393422 RepID=UPI003CEEE9B5
MANQHRQKLRGVRGVDDELWTDFGDATARNDSDRSAAIRHFMQWYVRRSGVEHPRRPAGEASRETA